jgi:hypothetical protein
MRADHGFPWEPIWEKSAAAVRHMKGGGDAIRDDGGGGNARSGNDWDGTWGAGRRKKVVCPRLFKLFVSIIRTWLVLKWALKLR